MSLVPFAHLYSSGINVYSSSDLLNWKNEGRALSPIVGTDIGPEKVVERPKAVFNEATQLWVLWFHADNSTYGLLRQGVAVSPNITGQGDLNCMRYHHETLVQGHIHSVRLLDL